MSCIAGINLPILRGAYDHDLAPNERSPEWGCAFEPLWAFRYLAMCKNLGFGAVRIWLCENSEGIATDGRGRLVGPMPELLESIRVLQEGARRLKLQLYWTLLDGNAWRRNGDELTGRVFGDQGEARRFGELVAAPIAATLDPKITFALEALNEPESLSSEVHGDDGLPWKTIAGSIDAIRAALHEAIPGVPVTAGSQAIFLPGLLESLDAGAPVDAVDLHVYHPDGGLPPREDLPVDIGDLPLWAGECGLSHRGDPERSEVLIHYLYNARDLGYLAAFLWKLEGDEHLVRRQQVPNARDGTVGFLLTPLGGGVQHLLATDWDGD